MSTIRTFECFC